MIFSHLLHHHDHPRCHKVVQVAGESVLMVVGGDNLADNQESSLEIYNRSGSIKLKLKFELVKIKKHYNNVEAIITLFCIRKKFSWSRGPPTRAKRDSCRFFTQLRNMTCFRIMPRSLLNGLFRLVVSDDTVFAIGD